jgi:DNA-binding NarL/FixJ family response regulator
MADAARLAVQARDEAIRIDSAPLRLAAEAVVGRSGRMGEAAELWAPLTAREFELARHVAAGRTNREIGAEIAAWVASVVVLHSRPHGGDREE